ncbi:MAG TPA: HAMP domain-containing sensor histidine kinase [Polyangiaceae bacterium]
MLRAFLSANREAILARSREKVRARPAPAATEEELEKGIPLLLDQLIGAFRDLDGLPLVRGLPPGRELTDLGVRVVQIVHDYERVFQAVVEVAEEAKASIDVAELHRLHRCLDEAVSEAVNEYSRRRERAISEQEKERLGILAHESRNAITAAMLAFQALQTGKVGIAGSTAGLLDRSLRRLSSLVETSIAQVRIEAGKHAPERVSLHDLVEDIEVGAAAQASALELELFVGRVEPGVDLVVDRQLLAAAIGNLLQNAFKFTRAHGAVRLDTSWTAERVRIAVKDECGGLPPGDAEALFRPFEQRGVNRAGLGLGLAISRRSVEADGGTLAVQDIPGTGCVFTVELPRLSAGI